MDKKILIGHLVVLFALVINIHLPQFPPQVQAAEITIASPSPTPSIDPRVLRLSSYLNNCPLQDYSQEFIDQADKYGIDWRLLPAISVKESSCGKRLINNNPFGWASGQKYFNSFSEAIEFVTSAIAGENPEVHAYTKASKDTGRILYLYNGTVNSNYPQSVEKIMEDIGAR